MKSSIHLPFLDTSIYIKNGQIVHCFYSKPTASSVVTNFKCYITPLKYKLSTLKGDVYRRYSTCSNDSDLKSAFVQLKNQFIANGYPSNLINKTVNII